MTKTDIEALMRPRYKLTADYPCNTEKVGYIYEQDINGHFWDSTCSEYEEEKTLQNYPHLFKPLAWYEDREASEMPEYVKSISTALSMKIGEVCKVKAWTKDIAKNGVWLEGKSFSRLIETVVPATESE